MPISYEYKTVFVHIPKTGGLSIAEMLGMNLTDHLFNFAGPSELTHLTAAELKHFVPDLWQSYFKFAIVRNPWDRLVSEYHYAQSRKYYPYFETNEIEFESSIQSKIDTLLRNRKPVNFKTFIKKIGTVDLSRLQHQNRTHLVPQYQFIYEGDKIIVDHVGRFEQFAQEAAVLQQRFRIEKEIPKLNTSEHEPYQEYYDDETRSIVAEVYKKDIELFRYQF